MSVSSITNFNNKPDPSISARVWNLQVDNQIIYNGPTGATGGTEDRFLNQKDGFRKINLPDLQLIGAGAPNDTVLTHKDGVISFQNFESNVLNGDTDGQVPIWSEEDNKYIPGTVGGGLPSGTQTRQVLLWNDDTNLPFWGNLATTADINTSNSDVGIMYGTAFVTSDSAGSTNLTSISNQNTLGIYNSTSSSILEDCDGCSIHDSNSIIIGPASVSSAVIASTGDNTFYAITGDNEQATSCIVGSSSNVQMYKGANNTILSTTGNTEQNINMSQATCSAQIATDNCSNQLTVCGSQLSTQDCFLTSGSRNIQSACYDCSTVNCFQTSVSASESSSLGSDTSYCSIDACTVCAINTSAQFSSVSASTSSSIVNSVVNSAIMGCHSTNILNSCEKCCALSCTDTNIGTISMNSTAIGCDGLTMNQATKVAAFGFSGYTMPSPLSNKVLGGLTEVEWCLHNDTGVLDAASVNTTGPFPSGQSRWMEIADEVNPDQYGRLVRLNSNFIIDYARNGEIPFGIIRNKDSAPLQFNSVKSGKVKKTDIWGKFIKDEEGNFIYEEYEPVPRALIETHGEYICQCKGDIQPGDYLVSDPNGFGVKSPNITNIRCYGVIDSDDTILLNNDSIACRCYINPYF